MRSKNLLKFIVSLSTFLFCFYSPLSLLAQEIDDDSSEAILQRIEPIGEVNVAGEEKKPSEPQSIAPTPATPAASASLTGEQIYNQYCSVCHSIGVAGAPKFKDKADWEARGGKKAIDTLIKVAVQGKNAMPPKGNRVTCQEKDIYNAILYMLPE